MAREFVEGYQEGDTYWEVYKDKDGYIIEGDVVDDDYDDIYGPTDTSGNYDGDD